MTTYDATNDNQLAIMMTQLGLIHMNSFSSFTWLILYHWINLLIHTLRPEQYGQHFTDNIFKCSFLTCLFLDIQCLIEISLKFVTKGRVQLTISQHWFRQWLGAYSTPTHLFSTNDGKYIWCPMESLDHNVLTNDKSLIFSWIPRSLLTWRLHYLKNILLSIMDIDIVLKISPTRTNTWNW